MRLLGSRVPHSAGGDKLLRATVLLSPRAHAHGSSLSTGSFFCCHIQVDQSKKKMGRWKDRKDGTHPLALTWIISMIGSPRPFLLCLPDRLYPVFTSPFVTALSCVYFGCGFLLQSNSTCIPCFSEFPYLISSPGGYILFSREDDPF